MSQNTPYNKFYRAVTLTDEELIWLYNTITQAYVSLSALQSNIFDLATHALIRDQQSLGNYIVARGLGYARTNEGQTQGVKVDHGSVYIKSWTGYGSGNDWVNVVKVPSCGRPDTVARKIANNIVQFKEGAYYGEVIACFNNHYKYLDAIAPIFWKKALGKSMDDDGCAGIVGAHGDKCYQYSSTWTSLGIPFYRGALLYLLTYTKLMGFPKHQSEWAVVDFYLTYKDLIIECEKEFKDTQCGHTTK